MAKNSFLSKDAVADLGLDHLPPAEQEKVLLQIGDIIFKKVMLRVVDELSESAKDEFTKLLDSQSQDQDAVLNFLQKKLPDFNFLVNEEVAGFKKEAVELMRKAKGN